MEIFWGLFVGFILGILVAYRAIALDRNANCIGTLREDNSDPTDQPYLFLELDKGGLEKIQTSKYVFLKVSRENYIPRK